MASRRLQRNSARNSKIQPSTFVSATATCERLVELNLAICVLWRPDLEPKTADAVLESQIRPCMRSFLSRGKFAWCLAPGGASGVRSRPAPARRNLGGAKCRWPDPCQGRSRRRRWPEASLYQGLASDDDRRPRSVGRDYAHLSLDLSPLPRA